MECPYFVMRSFINPFSTPCAPQSWGTFRFGGHPQTPDKGASPLCTPQLVNDLFVTGVALTMELRHNVSVVALCVTEVL